MKTEQQIKDKIKEHEDKINELLADEPEFWDDRHVSLIKSFLKCRKALVWVLSDADLLPRLCDDFEKRVMYEITCYESTKIF